MALTTIPSELSSVSGIADSSDATAITIDSSENVTFAGNILKTGDLTVDVSGVINLDAGTQVILKDDGTNYGTFYQTSSDFYIQSLVQDKDIVLYGNDGGSGIIALRLDMSEAGAATFNGELIAPNGATEGYHIKQTGGTATPRITNDANNWTIIRPGASGSDVAINIYANSANLVTFTDEGHVGIASTPTAWGSGYKSLQIGDRGYVAAHTGSDLYVGQNAYHNSGWKYEASVAASLTQHSGGQITHYVVGAGTAGNAITWTTGLHINTSGYVGIGELSPDNKLHVTGGDWNNAHIKIERTDNGSSNDPGLVLKSAAGANDAYGLGGIWFQNALDNNAYALIRGRTDDASGTSGKLEFVTSSSAVGNATYAAMTIKATGFVGIGGQSPANRLHIFGDAGDSRMQFTNSSSGNAYADGLWVGMDNTQAYILQRENLPVGIYTNATRRLVIEAGGAVVPEGDATQNLGSASKRWDNLYVNDMHFSNEGSDGNDVDGTTGDWTLQEGEEHLYIINNKSGKKFKFSLEEVG